MSAVACELKMHDLQAEKNTKITNKEFPFFSQFYFWKRKKMADPLPSIEPTIFVVLVSSS
jgi:hypothetical protein